MERVGCKKIEYIGIFIIRCSAKKDTSICWHSLSIYAEKARVTLLCELGEGEWGVHNIIISTPNMHNIHQHMMAHFVNHKYKYITEYKYKKRGVIVNFVMSPVL